MVRYPDKTIPNLGNWCTGFGKTSTSSVLFIKKGFEFFKSRKLKDKWLFSKKLTTPSRATYSLEKQQS